MQVSVLDFVPFITLNLAQIKGSHENLSLVRVNFFMLLFFKDELPKAKYHLVFVYLHHFSHHIYHAW